MPEKEKSPMKAVSVMMIITLLGKVLGLVRDRLLTVNYGSGMATSAFLTASRIPRVFFDTIFASAISASLIPIFSEYLMKKGRKEAYSFAGNFITVMTALCVVLTAAGMIFAGNLTAFFADGYDAETAALCTELTRIMMPTIMFTGVAFSFVGVLQSLGEFNVPAAISLVSNCAVIAYYFTLNDRYGIYGLAVTFLIAWLLQAAVQIPSLIKRGFKFVPSLSIKNEGMKKVFALMLPVMVSTWVLPINQTINSKYGSRLFDGAGVSAVELAYNLYTVIAGVFVLSVTNFIFPRLSRQHADGDTGGARDTIRGTMHSSLYVVLPMAAGLCVMAKPLVGYIYGGGEFDEFSVNITARALSFMSLGMIGYAIQAVLCRAFFAEQNGKMPLIAGTASIVTNIVICAALTNTLDVAGIAIASAAAFSVNGIILALALRRKGMGFADKKFCIDMAKDILSVAAMAAGVCLIRDRLSETCGKLTVLVIPACVGVVIYFVLTAVLRVQEAQMCIGFVRKFIPGRKGGE